MTDLGQKIAHLQKLQAKHSKNIHTLEEMLASFGMERPLKLINELEFEQEQLRQVEEHLAELAVLVETGEAPTALAEPKEARPMTSMRRLLADRGPELNFFDCMVAGEADYCILLIESEAGMGKSTLLRAYGRRCPPEVTCVTVDFKGELALADAFYLMARGLEVANLPQFGAQVAQIAHPEQVAVSGNVLIGLTGRAEIQVALQAPNEETRRFRRAALTDALFADLTALERRVVFIFDTLNEAAPNVRNWLLGPFLGHLRHCRGTVAVVASRPPLEEHTTWAAHCERVRLEGITEPEDWHAGLRALDLALSIKTIHAYCVLFDGHPLQVMTALDKFIRAEPEMGGRGGGR